MVGSIVIAYYLGVANRVDVNRHGIRSLQLGVLTRRPEFPGTFGPPHDDPWGYLIANQSLQVEYAVKAVENGGTAIGIRCKDGVVLAVEKTITSKLLKSGANKRIATVDRHVGIVRTPFSPFNDNILAETNQHLTI